MNVNRVAAHPDLLYAFAWNKNFKKRQLGLYGGFLFRTKAQRRSRHTCFNERHAL